MPHPDAERAAENQDDGKPLVGADPMHPPHDEDSDVYHAVHLDQEKVEEREREREEHREHDPPEERAERIENA